jgi:hypothetical protein
MHGLVGLAFAFAIMPLGAASHPISSDNYFLAAHRRLY